jgi:uncharacterized protein (TIGR02996 family)
MGTDAAFLRSIEADLADPAPILIYADWREEQGKEKPVEQSTKQGSKGRRWAAKAGPKARICSAVIGNLPRGVRSACGRPEGIQW